jgi:diaminohydroxyphosphoribosylaminopyrimidine deaminase/5-amino-6-(5-phosphoribosylamino)uracil reductase
LAVITLDSENKPQHEHYMRLALELAARARGRTTPNPLVGAVIVRDGKIIGQGYHQKAGTPHAEVHALREAGDMARGSTMYVTLEPCSHYGRTPPCSKAVIESGVAGVYVAMQDPNPKVAGRGIQQLKDAGIKVEVGILEEEARRLNEIFIKYITTKRPFVLLKTAMTLDGKIAARTGHARWVTGPEARDKVHRIRDEYDAILVGVNTVIADDPELTCRLPGGGGHDPVRVILDSRARTPLTARVLQPESPAATVIVTTDAAPPENAAALKAAGAEIITVSNRDGRVDLPELLAELGRREITSLLVEGGAEVSAAFLDGALVDKVLWFVAPKIVGGRDAPGPVGGTGRERMDEALVLRDISWEQNGSDIYVEGYPDYVHRNS